MTGACFDEDRRILDPKTRTDIDLAVTLRSASWINHGGQILAQGRINRQDRGCILILPEPTSQVVFGLI